jgi:monoamine oxidase
MQTEILIVGAGLSGLALAHALRDRGIPCLLVEARERSGGRILTLQKQVDGIGRTVADIGPSWVWPGQQRVARLLRHYDIELFEQHSSGLLVYEDELGQVRRDLDFSTMAGSLRAVGGLARLPLAMAADLADSCLLSSHRVTRILREKTGYRIDIEHAGSNIQVHARRVALALPPRVALRDIAFEPELEPGVTRDLAAIPTWMAGHAKLFALYPSPFWRDQGFSGDAISRRGPLMEIHDASPADAAYGALFGFVGIPVESPTRQPATLVEAAMAQLIHLFGNDAASPCDMQLKDWYADPFTATPDDAATGAHPAYGMPASLTALAEQGLVFTSTEMASTTGGFIEGALEASASALDFLA